MEKTIKLKLQYVTSAILALVIIFAPIVGTFQKVQGQSSIIASDEIDQYIRNQMAQKNIVGMAVAIVENGETDYLKGFGVSNIDKQTTVTSQTIFDLASCSKSFTAMATLLLWYDGKINLDQPLKSYIPEFQTEDVEISDKITVRQLLNQTSGIPGNAAEPQMFHNTFEELIAAMKNVHTDRTPGSAFEYSNLNYCLLGALIERVSGQAFEDFIQERIFNPLGMTNTTLKPEIAETLDHASGHQLKLGKVIVRNIPTYRSAAPAGWVMSCAADMGKWLQVNINEGQLNNQQVIPAEVIMQMQTPAIDLVKNGGKVSYGMGWFVGETTEGEPIIWHGGDTPTFLSEMIILPERNLGIVMLVNSQTSKDAHSVAIGIAGILMGSELKLASSPWWASWAEIDHIALIALILASISMLGLIPFFWWQKRIIDHYKKGETARTPVGKIMRIWLIALPATPWGFLALIVMAAYVVIQTLFGYNLFKVLIRSGDFAPPGVSIAAITLTISVILWILAINITGSLKAHSRTKVLTKP